MSRPIPEEKRIQFAYFLALGDSCDFPEHNEAALGKSQCPYCHLDLWSYLDITPRSWPS